MADPQYQYHFNQKHIIQIEIQKMFAAKHYFVLLAACVALAAAVPLAFEGELRPDDAYPAYYPEEQPLVRVARSPQGGSLGLGYSKDQSGRSASVDYNHNLWSSRDGNGRIDAYAQGTRNFDWNRNDFAGGLRGSWRF